MDEGARRWLVKTATKQFWRVQRTYELDDLIQDGYLCYYKVLMKYPAATDAPHRMALFKIVYSNYIHDLANKRTKSVTEFLASDLGPREDDSGIDGDSIIAAMPCPGSGLVTIGAMLASAPAHVREVLMLFTDEQRLTSMRSAYRLRRGGKHLVRETMNERLCRMLGYDPAEVDLVGEVRDFLSA